MEEKQTESSHYVCVCMSVIAGIPSNGYFYVLGLPSSLERLNLESSKLAGHGKYYTKANT